MLRLWRSGASRAQTEGVLQLNRREGGPWMQYLGIHWSYRRAVWCALGEGGAIVGEGAECPPARTGLGAWCSRSASTLKRAWR